LEKDIVYLKTKTIMKNTMNEIDEGFHLTWTLYPLVILTYKLSFFLIFFLN
jgi:hypothetical protein